jgi:hypothetical protein
MQTRKLALFLDCAIDKAEVPFGGTQPWAPFLYVRQNDSRGKPRAVYFLHVTLQVFHRETAAAPSGALFHGRDPSK